MRRCHLRCSRAPALRARQQEAPGVQAAQAGVDILLKRDGKEGVEPLETEGDEDDEDALD